VPPEVPPARRGPGPQPRLLNTVPTELPRLLRSRGRVPRGACGMLAVGFARSCPRARRAGATRRGSARGPEPRAGSPRRGGSRQDLPASAPVGRRGGMPDRPGGGCRVRDGARIRGPACAVRADARASRASAESAARRVEHGVRLSAGPPPDRFLVGLAVLSLVAMGRRALRLQAGVDAAIGLFGAGSCLCALVETAGELIAFRVLQALGGVMLLRSGSRSSRSARDRSRSAGARRPRAAGAPGADLRAHPRRRDHRRSGLAMAVRREPVNRSCGDRRRCARARRSSRSPPGCCSSGCWRGTALASHGA